MTKPKTGVIFGVMVVILAAMGWAAMSPGGFFIGKHEGDTLHLLEILFRMEAGEAPHADFMTPIGFMAFTPMVAFLQAGFSVAEAIFWAQIAVGLALLPCALWVGASRMSTPLACLFGAVIMIYAVALVHGEAQRSASISMHYNRWAWAAAFMAIAIALLPPRFRQSALADGGVLGAAMAFLALSKVTYFVAFFPPILIALLMRRDWAAAGVALVVGAVAIVATTLVYGIGFWGGYVGDMLTVAGSTVRAAPGEPLTAVMGAPAYIGGSLVAVLAVILMRQGQRANEGLLLLLLIPGFFYVTFQNYGNDPQWLMLLAVLLLARLPDEGIVNGWGWDMQRAVQMTGVAALALIVPSFFNMAYSPFRHAAIDTEQYTELMPNDPRHADLRIMNFRAYTLDARVPMDVPGSGLEPYGAKVERSELGELNGEPLRRCALEVGMTGWFQFIADDLTAHGYAGTRIFWADLFGSVWLFGDFQRLEGGAPWYYGALPGFETADYVLVPNCPIAMDVRKQVLEAIDAEGVSLREVHSTPVYTLLEKSEG